MPVKELERRSVTRTALALASDTGIVQLPIDQIRTDGGTQPRAGLNADTVADYVADMERGDRFPPLDVMYDGQSYWLFDGFHRLAALRALGRQAVEVWIHQGDLSDAQWQSYAANKGHGLRRTNADKERSVKAALRHPKAAHMSDSAIAAHVGVSDKTVAKYRAELEASSEIPKIEQRTVTRGGSTFVMDTSKIGQKPSALTLDETIAFVWQMIKRHARDADTATRLAWLNKPTINFHVEAQRADLAKLDETTLREALKRITAELQLLLAREQRKQQRREEQAAKTPPVIALDEIAARLREWLDRQEWSAPKQIEVLVELADNNARARWWDQVWAAMPGGVAKRDVRQAVSFVLEQLRQRLAEETERKLLNSRPAAPPQAEPAPVADTDPTPADLREAGFAILPHGNGWKWRLIYPNGNTEQGLFTDTPEEAIKWARGHCSILRMQGKLPYPEAPAQPVPAEPLRLTPADVRAAGYIIEPYNEQWRWRRELLAGGIEYGAPYRTRDAAIADARRMVQARGPAAPAEPAPATLDDLDVLDRELAPWPLDSEAAVGEELDDPFEAAGRMVAAGSGSAPEANSPQPDEDPRIAELRATIAIYQAALGAGSAYVRLTGFHTHRMQADRILRTMIEQLERNLTALEGDHD